MPPMPQVYLYATASRLILAGCRCRKTLLRALRARLRGVPSCFTRRTDSQTSVFSGALMVSLSSSVARACTALAPARTLATVPPPSPFPLPAGGVPGAGFPLCPLVSAMMTSHVAKNGAVVAKLRRLAFRPGIEVTQIDLNLPLGVELHMSAIHGPRSRTLEVDSLG